MFGRAGRKGGSGGEDGRLRNVEGCGWKGGGEGIGGGERGEGFGVR